MRRPKCLHTVTYSPAWLDVRSIRATVKAATVGAAVAKFRRCLNREPVFYLHENGQIQFRPDRSNPGLWEEIAVATE